MAASRLAKTRFKPTILLLFKIGHSLLQRLLFAQRFCFFISVNFSVNVLLQIPIEKSLELDSNDFDSLLIRLNKSRNGLGRCCFIFFQSCIKFFPPNPQAKKLFEAERKFVYLSFLGEYMVRDI